MKRRGATLVEVLVAIFVMALGMMALLVLFPIGALSMARAIQDDRAAHAAANADAVATMKLIRNDPVVVFGSGKAEPDVFAKPLGPWKPPDPQGPSNPVIVDPAGYRMTAANGWVAGVADLLPRRDTSFTDFKAGILPSETLRWFAFLDDYDFDRLVGVTSFPVTRDYRYSWAYLLRRPKTSEPTVVDMSVMVFKSRPMALTSTVTLREFVYGPGSPYPPALFDPQRNIVTIDYNLLTGGAGDPPPLRAGDWILGASATQTANFRYSHAYFYRAVSVTEIAGNKVEVEVQTPLRGFAPPFVANPGGYPGTVIIFDGLVEVFERGTGWK
jgi:hypothetical protein